jgi:hypothetical protein
MTLSTGTANPEIPAHFGVAARAFAHLLAQDLGRALSDVEIAVIASMQETLPRDLPDTYEELLPKFARLVLAAAMPVSSFLKGTPIKLLWRSSPALSESAYVTRLLKLVNGELREPDLNELLMGVSLKRRVRGPLATVDVRLVEQLRADVACVAAGTAKERKMVRQRALAALQDRYIATAGVECDERRIFFETVEAALSYALLLLCDPNRPYARDLSRCKYRECRRFFLVERTQETGRTARDHCCAEHKELELTLRNRERVAKYKRDKRVGNG